MQQDVGKQLAERFARPLGDFEPRRVVVWHDGDGSFEGEFERFATFGFDDGLASERPIRFVKADEESQFMLKRLVYREEHARRVPINHRVRYGGAFAA